MGKIEPRQPFWHALSPDKVFALLKCDRNGLTQAESQKRLQAYGENRLAVHLARNPFLRFLSQFHNVLVYLLLAAAGITYWIGETVDSAVIVGVTVINAIIGFVQEGKAEQALAGIRKLLTFDAKVRRDNIERVIPSEQLVPGDIVLLESGDKVPADVRLILAKNLRIDESMLTGESIPVEKYIDTLDPGVVLAERRNMTYSGTLVTYGAGVGIVVATGNQTEIGQINKLLGAVAPIATPLLRQIARFSQWLTIIILAIASVTFGYGWYFQHTAPTDLFMAVVSLAVAAIPEGLPAIMTITLAIGVQKMAKYQAIVRHLPAVETLGSVNVICTDKTGTLTCNEMTVKSVYAGNKLFTVDGVGYDPTQGCIKQDGETIDVDKFGDLLRLIKVSALCNNAALAQDNGAWKPEGDPTEAALITLAMRAKVSVSDLKILLPRIDSIPFESEHGFMATLHRDADQQFLLLKGAPERLFALCSQQQVDGSLQPLGLPECQRQVTKLAAKGQRLIAVAVKTFLSTEMPLSMNDVGTDLVLLGIVGMIDPPRQEALNAVRRCRAAGIRVKMITGDHALTAQTIAEQLQIGQGTVISGKTIDQMTDSQLQSEANSADIFARVSPENKLRLVAALQAHHHIVAMTGDGVNDAPALRCADIGIAMGKKGTEVAKEASEMVLADDNFATITKAVEIGRTVYDNLKKAIIYILPTSFAEAFVIVAATFSGNVLPITPLQILWINMVTETTLSLTLAFESSEQNVMARPPRKPDEPLLSGFLVWRIFLVTCLMVGGTYGLFLWELQQSGSVQAARTVAVNTLVMFEIFYVFNSRYLTQSALTVKGIFGSWLVWLAVIVLVAAQMGFTYWPVMQDVFKTVGITWRSWQTILAAAAILFFVIEIEKAVIRFSPFIVQASIGVVEFGIRQEGIIHQY